MKVAIIGAGFTGLAAGFYLAKAGTKVFLFEKEEKPGGLAVGATVDKNWFWTIERHYHHLFTSDFKIIGLAKEVGVPIIFKRPKTSVFVDNQTFPFDSPSSILSFPKLNIFEKLRMGIVLFSFKINPFWKPLEKIPAEKSLQILLGERSYRMIWQPLLSAKFRQFLNGIPLSWFWARIKKRSPHLGYPEGGFQNLADKIARQIQKNGGKIYLNTAVNSIRRKNKNLEVIFTNYSNNRSELLVNKVIVTLPSFTLLKIIPTLPNDYKKVLLSLHGLGALNLVLFLKEKFLKDGTYWLNICDKNFPFLSIVEHTNFMDPKYYNGQHIVYIGNYLPIGHPYMKMSADQLFKIYDPYLKKLNPNYTLSPIPYTLFKAPFAQPVVTLNYSKIIPPLETPIKNVYLANIQQVYPWDRGTNYAVELGEKVAKLVISS